MSSHFPPLELRDIEHGLTKLGFAKGPAKAGSHQKWSKVENDRKWVVTVDAPKAPFSADLVTFMARQAGVSKLDFYQACGK